MMEKIKKAITFLVLIPLSAAITVGGIYLLSNVNFEYVTIPNWYEEKPFEPAPVNKFVDYWKEKSYEYASYTFAIIFGFMLPLYILKNHKNINKRA